MFAIFFQFHARFSSIVNRSSSLVYRFESIVIEDTRNDQEGYRSDFLLEREREEGREGKKKEGRKKEEGKEDETDSKFDCRVNRKSRIVEIKER